MGKSPKFELLAHFTCSQAKCYIIFHDWVAFKLFIMSVTGFITVYKIHFIIFNILLFLFLIPGPWLLSSG